MSTARYILAFLAVLMMLGMALAACGAEPTMVPAAATPVPLPTSTALPATATAVPAKSEPTKSATATAATATETATATTAPDPTATPTGVPPTVSPTATSVPPTAAPEPEPVTVTASDGAEVVFEAPPERMVVYDGAAVEMLFAIGQGHRIVGTHSYVTYPPETESISKVGNAFNMDIEAIVALEPDLVYVFYDRFNEDLERAGLKVLYIKSLSHGFTEVADQIRMWGSITGGDDEAERVAGDFDARVAEIKEKLESQEPTRSVYEHGFDWWTPGRKTLVNDVFELLKLKNVADFEGYQQISPEAVVIADPDIIMGDPASVAAEPALSGLHSAEPQYIFMLSEGNSFSVAGPRFMDAVEEMAAWVYPDLFQ